MMMKQYILPVFCLLLFLVLGFTTFAQTESSSQIPFQAVARQADGTLMANQTISVRVSLAEADLLGRVYYSEEHTLETDETGYFSLRIGAGLPIVGQWEDIPWPQGNLYLNIEMDATAAKDYELVSRIPLQTVPYAFAAQTAQYLERNEEVTERNNSNIHWNTRGNNRTIPNIDFVGTRDAEDFFVKTNEATRIVFSDRGQMTIYADRRKNDGTYFTADQEATTAYQLYVKGHQQGVYIEINEPRSTANNFLTFADQDKIRGCIEGQNREELVNSETFINTNADFAVSIATQTAITAAEAAQAVGYAAAATLSGISIFFAWKIPGYTGAAAGATGQAVAAGVALASITGQTADYNVTTISKVGVSYTSGGADYAEYLMRAPQERDLYPGEIVGVHGGKVSLQTVDAHHLLVISEAPAVLGNLPSPERLDLFEKVAFMGQVSVRVIGDVNAGDYILPSGRNDGLAVAVAPEALPTVQFSQIIGTSWETRIGAEYQIHLVNISVGLNRNDLTPRVAQLSDKVDNIMAFLEGKEALKDFGMATTDSLSSNDVTRFGKTQGFSQAMFDQTIEQYAPLIEQYYQDLEQLLQQEGVRLRDYPVWQVILENPVQHVKERQHKLASAGHGTSLYLQIPQNQ